MGRRCAQLWRPRARAPVRPRARAGAGAGGAAGGRTDGNASGAARPAAGRGAAASSAPGRLRPAQARERVGLRGPVRKTAINTYDVDWLGTLAAYAEEASVRCHAWPSRMPQAWQVTVHSGRVRPRLSHVVADKVCGRPDERALVAQRWLAFLPIRQLQQRVIPGGGVVLRPCSSQG